MSSQPKTSDKSPSPPVHKDPAAEFTRNREVSEAVANRLRALDEPAEQHLPAKHRKGIRWGLICLGVLGLGLIAGGVFYYFAYIQGADKFSDLEFQALTRGKLVLSFVDKGELEAAESTDIKCRVRSSGRGNSVASSIKWLIEEGARVKQDEVLVRLDDSGLKEQLKNQKIVVEGKKSLLVQADKDFEITKIKSENEVLTAVNNFELAKIDLEKYVGKVAADDIITNWNEAKLREFIKWDEVKLKVWTDMIKERATQKQKEDPTARATELGDFEKKLAELEGQLSLAEATLLQNKEKLEWSARMVKLGYVSASTAQADENRYKEALEKRNVILMDQKQLLRHDAKRMILDFVNKLKQAESQIQVAEKNREGTLAQAKAKLDEAKSVLAAEESKQSDLEEDIENCTIKAPRDGMVVYHVDERNRFGGSQSNVIAIGESVRESQSIMRIPDLRQMQVRVKVHEGLISRLQEGLPAQIKIAGVEQPMKGNVRTVSSVASSTDWMSSDVKVYPTTVLIDTDSVPTGTDLKPQMSAEVTILIRELEDVLRLPVHAVLENNGRKFCYVRTPDGIEKRILATGLNNTKFVEVKEGDVPKGIIVREGEKFGLQEGESIVLNPRGYAERQGDLHTEARDPGEGMEIDPTKLGKKFVDPTKNGGDEKRPRGGPDSKRGGPGGERGSPGGPGAGPGAGPGGPGGPGGGQRGAGGGGRGGFGSPEDQARMQKQYDELKDALQKAKTPADKKKTLDRFFADREKEMKDRGIPEDRIQQFFPFIKDATKKKLAEDGVEVPE
jgi:multidrug efflux pump subunit AcrA (membrane-fusion protein)